MGFVDGELKMASGDRYEGTFKTWKMHGKGTYTTQNGDTYKGTFVNGEFEDGELKMASGDRYEGKFVNGRLFHNFFNAATLTTLDGKKDVGEFVCEQFNSELSEKTLKVLGTAEILELLTLKRNDVCSENAHVKTKLTYLNEKDMKTLKTLVLQLEIVKLETELVNCTDEEKKVLKSKLEVLNEKKNQLVSEGK